MAAEVANKPSGAGRTGPTLGGMPALIWLLPLVVFVLLLIRSLSNYRSSQNSAAELTRDYTSMLAEQTARHWQAVLEQQAGDLALLADLLQNPSDDARRLVAEEAKAIVARDPPTFEMIGFTPAAQLASPSHGLLASRGTLQFAETEDCRDVHDRLSQTGKPWACRSAEAVGGRPGITIWYPVFFRDGGSQRYAGAITGSFLADLLIGQTVRPLGPSDPWLTLRLDERDVYSTKDKGVRVPQPLAELKATTTVTALDRHWQVQAMPRPGGKLGRLAQDNARRLTANVVLSLLIVGLIAFSFVAIGKARRGEVALRESERRYRSIFDNAADAVLLHDFQGRILDANPVACRRLNYTLQELLGKTILEVDSPESARQFLRDIERLRREGSILFEGEHLTRNGRRVPVEINARVIDYQGTPTVLSIIRDISERRHAERALRESETRFRELFGSIRSGVAVFEAVDEGEDFLIRDLNPAAEQIEGRSKDQILGRRVTEAFPAIRHIGLLEVFRQVWRTGTAAHHPAAYYDDGRIRGWRENYVYKLPSGEVVAVYDDVTEQKQAEERLRLTQFSVDRAEISVFWIDKDAQFLYVNQAACRSLGYTREELESMGVYDIDPEFPRETWSDHWESVNQAGSRTFETVHQARDGRIFPVEITANYLEFRGRSCHCVFARDITERKRVEEALRQSEERFRRAVTDAPLPVIIHAEDGEILQVNRAWIEISGYSSEDIPTVADWTAKAYGGQREMVRAAIDHLYQLDRREAQDEFEITTRSGEKRIWDFSSAPLGRLPDGRRTVISMAMDVTERRRAEDELASRKKFIETVLENLPIGVMVICAETGPILYLNAAFVQMHGWPREALPDREQLLECLFPDPEARRQTRERMDQTILAVPRKPVDWGDTCVTTSTGEKRIITVTGIPLPERDTWVFATLDVTEERRAEQALRESEGKLRSIFLAAPTGIGVVRRRVIVQVNERLCQMLGYAGDELVGNNSRMLYPTDQEFERVGQEKYRQISETGVGTVETQWVRKDGRLIDVLLSSAKMDPADPDTPVSFTALDITERKRAEAQLHRHIQELLLLSSITRQATVARSMNEVADVVLREIVNATEAEVGILYLRDNDILQLQRVYPQDARYAQVGAGLHKVGQCLCGQAAEGKAVYSTDIHGDPRCVLTECKRAGLRSFAALPLAKEGRIIGVLGFASFQEHDFSQRAAFLETVANQIAIIIQNVLLHERLASYAQELEQRVAERTAKLQEANQELEAFAYSVSHDLRAPLRSIVGFSSIVMNEAAQKLDSRDRENLQRVVAASRHMNELIEGMLQLSRMSRAAMHRRQVDLSEMARGIAKELRERNPDRNVEFSIQPDVTVTGDATLLQVVMENLLENAWKFTSKRDAARIEFGAESSNGEQVCHVRDNGAGFDMEYVGKLFIPFSRLHTAGEFEGTGIGLATVRRVIQRHGGRIWAEGRPDQGATFYFTL